MINGGHGGSPRPTPGQAAAAATRARPAPAQASCARTPRPELRSRVASPSRRLLCHVERGGRVASTLLAHGCDAAPSTGPRSDNASLSDMALALSSLGRCATLQKPSFCKLGLGSKPRDQGAVTGPAARMIHAAPSRWLQQRCVWRLRRLTHEQPPRQRTKAAAAWPSPSAP